MVYGQTTKSMKIGQYFSKQNPRKTKSDQTLVLDVIGDQQLASWFGLMDIRVSQNMTTCKYSWHNRHHYHHCIHCLDVDRSI